MDEDETPWIVEQRVAEVAFDIAGKNLLVLSLSLFELTVIVGRQVAFILMIQCFH